MPLLMVRALFELGEFERARAVLTQIQARRSFRF